MKVLIILASYNGVRYIEEQIDSILIQNGVDISLFIFDDGSSDGTIDLVNSIKMNKSIQFIENSSPTGSAANNFFNALQSFEDSFIEMYAKINGFSSVDFAAARM